MQDARTPQKILPALVASSPPTSAAIADWQLERQEHGRLDCIDSQGQRHTNVDAVRAFPISAPQGPVAIVAADGMELAWIDSLAALQPSLQSLLIEELALREFLPVIRRIESVSDREPTEWLVETDRGQRRFIVAHSDDIIRLPDASAVISDMFGVRYLIKSVPLLDALSRRLFEKSL